MVNKLFRRYNQNRKDILTIIIVIVFTYILLQVVFGLIRSNNKRKMEQLVEQYNNEQSENKNYQSNTINSTTTDDKQEVAEEKSKAAIEKFVMLCNQNKIDESYSMLSDDCKKVLFMTTSIFDKNYVKKIFTEKRIAQIERSMYGTNIYKVTYNNNVLSSGATKSNKIVDYIYVEKKNDKYTLSLNKFLYIKTIEKNSNDEKVNIKIIEKQTFIDYEIYTIEVNNKTSNEILLANKNNVNNISLTDGKGVIYSSYIDELATEALIVQPNGIKTINIKFNKAYNTKRKLNYMSFNIIMNYKKDMKEQDFQILRQRIEI